MWNGSFVYFVSKDPWHSHLLPSVWQWSYHYLFEQLTSVATGYWTPIYSMWGELCTNWTPRWFSLYSDHASHCCLFLIYVYINNIKSVSHLQLCILISTYDYSHFVFFFEILLTQRIHVDTLKDRTGGNHLYNNKNQL